MNVICVIYLDNILIFNKNLTNHQCHVQQVLEHFKDFEYYINLKKYKFDIEKIEFLNFTIFTKEIQMNLKRI